MNQTNFSKFFVGVWEKFSLICNLNTHQTVIFGEYVAHILSQDMCESEGDTTCTINVYFKDSRYLSLFLTHLQNVFQVHSHNSCEDSAHVTAVTLYPNFSIDTGSQLSIDINLVCKQDSTIMLEDCNIFGLQLDLGGVIKQFQEFDHYCHHNISTSPFRDILEFTDIINNIRDKECKLLILTYQHFLQVHKFTPSKHGLVAYDRYWKGILKKAENMYYMGWFIYNYKHVYECSCNAITFVNIIHNHDDDDCSLVKMCTICTKQTVIFNDFV
jgi:hypothetical protein